MDRHVEAGKRDKVALHWVGEPEDDNRDITYAELKDEVCQAANALTELGVRNADRVAIYMPMIPETVVAMLACARLGAARTVVFDGFSADALASRVTDCEAKAIITADGGYRRGSPSALKPAVDEACGKTKDIVGEGAGGASYRPGRQVGRRSRRVVARVVDQASIEHEPEMHDAEHPLFVVYTSGTTGTPQGHPAHDGRLPRRRGWPTWIRPVTRASRTAGRTHTCSTRRGSQLGRNRAFGGALNRPEAVV